MPEFKIIQGDALAVLRTLEAESVHTCVTSPPYWNLRDYGVEGQLGLEKTPGEYVTNMGDLFDEVRRVLRADGTLWLNLGDSYTSGGRDYRDAGKSEYNGGNEGAYRGLQEKGKRADTSPGLKPKDLVGIPWHVAFALQERGWYLRSDIIWHKPQPMPESVTDRPTKSHEYIFLLSKSADYYYDWEAIKEKASRDTHARSRKQRAVSTEKTTPTSERNGIRPPGVGPKGSAADSGIRYNESFSASVTQVLEYRNKRSVWTIPTEAYPEAHFATFPEALVRPCILAGCPKGGTVLDPFAGSGTTMSVAKELGCSAIGIELNPAYIPLIEKRLAQDVLPLEAL